MKAPQLRKDVVRHQTFPFEIKKTDTAESDQGKGLFSGYASVFGNTDSYKEVMAKGSFSESLMRIKASGDPLPVLWQHSSYDPIGGSGDLTEDDHGLFTNGFLLLKIQRAAEAFALMKERVVKGLSIGYYPQEWSYNEETGILTHEKVDLVEYSVVTFPANELATVEEVKAKMRGILESGELPTLKEFEDFLREAGFSNTQSKAIAGNGLSKLLGQCEADGAVTAKALNLLDRFKI